MLLWLASVLKDGPMNSDGGKVFNKILRKCSPSRGIEWAPIARTIKAWGKLSKCKPCNTW